MARTKGSKKTPCEWTEADEGAYWATACNEAFTFNTDGPTENGIKFCPYCGRVVKAKSAREAA